MLTNIFAGIIALIFAFIALTAKQRTFNVEEIASAIAASFVVISIMQAFQFPAYFKLGYTKAKSAVYLPFIVFFLGAMLVSRFVESGGFIGWLVGISLWVGANPVISAFLSIIIWLVIIAISYRLSLAFYSKRDF